MSEQHLEAGRRAPARPSCRPSGSPRAARVTPAFLASDPVLMYADGGPGRTTVLCPALIVAVPVAGRYGIRGRTSRTSTGAAA